MNKITVVRSSDHNESMPTGLFDWDNNVLLLPLLLLQNLSVMAKFSGYEGMDLPSSARCDPAAELFGIT